MKKLTFLMLVFLSIHGINAQTQAEIIGKTITDSIQIINGATTGHILQSADGMGLGKWVSPAVLGDNLGDHTATATIKMDGNQMIGLDSVTFKNGQIIDQATAGTLKFNAHLDLQCNNLDNVALINFCPTGMAAPISTIMAVPSPGAGIADEIIMMNPGGPGPPAAVALGVGGPANPIILPPLANLLGVPMLPPGLPFNLGVHGDAWAFNWWAVSDARFKKDISTFDQAIEKILQLKPVTYQLNQERFPGRSFYSGPTYGFLAQDLLEVTPELVRMGSDGYYRVQYNGLIAILTEGIQELDEKINDNQEVLKAEITALKKENRELEIRLKKLEDRLVNK
ncbi:MAG: hypothetical protein HKN76_17530 [Saprospiraceae bacterium]|nr:hypothetical protein [Saprospiraceae bacterium]